jgi:hypothetical protein
MLAPGIITARAAWTWRRSARSISVSASLGDRLAGAERQAGAAQQAGEGEQTARPGVASWPPRGAVAGSARGDDAGRVAVANMRAGSLQATLYRLSPPGAHLAMPQVATASPLRCRFDTMEGRRPCDRSLTGAARLPPRMRLHRDNYGHAGVTALPLRRAVGSPARRAAPASMPRCPGDRPRLRRTPASVVARTRRGFDWLDYDGYRGIRFRPGAVVGGCGLLPRSRTTSASFKHRVDVPRSRRRRAVALRPGPVRLDTRPPAGSATRLRRPESCTR